ncbi:MAG: WbqC family protein [Salinimicrobium sediminis]|uniref:WbqC-like protein family protein n=1 Tax=Salinimicrobium sediminis TaxID=1343891 RepID=A0A285X913_9FLAO|nr:WbqC family protein [Salinimicrobium sediminis]MDX1602059.1 WbqC family protein [Salinimicrobium sediminis]SOC81496.1 WbqC-like protein family protein [Salinimicrobium sediminis]
MHKLLLHPAYFGPVSQYAAMIKAEKVVFENEDNYQKQTYRNRMYIYGANGKLSLNVPIRHTGNKSNHQKYRDVRIENDFPWQKQHWRSLETVYRTSPFFEFYEDDFKPLYDENFEFLIDFNYKCFELAQESLQVEINFEKTTEYFLNPEGMVNGRSLINAKNSKPVIIEPYTQVFQEKFGFLNDLSIVDLLFNEGPNAINYLKNQKVLLPDP